jgi:hypothetical protein
MSHQGTTSLWYVSIKYVNLVSVVKRFSVYPLRWKRVDVIGCQMGSFSTPVTSFFVRRGSPVTSDKDVELSRQLLLGAYNMCVVARQ